jgi:hypothetical protein
VKIRNSVFAVTLSLAAIAATAQTSRLQATPAAASAPTAIPALVPYSGTASAADGKPLTGEASITFLIFKEEAGGEPLWTETQSAVIDSTGRFKVQLGAANPNGLPPDLFANGEARWLEVQIAGEAAQARVLLASVPYALKAGDATTLGGLPVSAFALAASASAARATIGEPAGIPTDTLSNVTTVGGVSGYVPVFTGASTIADSLLFASSTGVGIGDTPASSDALDVNGKSIFRNNMSLARNGNASTSAGANSFPIVFNTMTYNSSSKAYTFPFFYFQAEASGNNTASPGATMNFLYNANSSTPAETGLYFNANGTIHFAAGQTFGATSSSGVAFNGTSTSNNGVEGTSSSGDGILGTTAGTTVHTAGVFGIAGTGNTSGYSGVAGVWGDANAHVGVLGTSTQYDGVAGFSADNYGVYGQTDASSGGYAGVYGYSSDNLPGVRGESNIGTGGAFYGGTNESANATGGDGIYADGGGGFYGGHGITSYGGEGSYSGDGIVTYGGNGSDDGGDGINAYGGDGTNQYTSGSGIYATGGSGTTGGTAAAAYFAGNVTVTGTLSAEVKNLQIDHPLDPGNKYLNHTSVESSEMMDIYTGNVTTDELGQAIVTLPGWFQSLNADFRYQLTVVGGRFAQAIVSKEIENNQFTISTNATGVKVSWQVTAVRQDAYAKAHPLVVEETKPVSEQGFYIHPELYGQPEEKQTEWGRKPEMMRRGRALRAARMSGPAGAGSKALYKKPSVGQLASSQ